MKQLMVSMVLLLSATIMYAQNVIILNNGETINGQVAEVGINEVKYYKSSNLQGPIYVAAKSEVRQITYANESKDVFANTQQPTTVIVQQPAPQIVIVQQQSRRINNWNNGWWYSMVSAHIDLGRHGGGYYRSYGGGHLGKKASLIQLTELKC